MRSYLDWLRYLAQSIEGQFSVHMSASSILGGCRKRPSGSYRLEKSAASCTFTTYALLKGSHPLVRTGNCLRFLLNRSRKPRNLTVSITQGLKAPGKTHFERNYAVAISQNPFDCNPDPLDRIALPWEQILGDWEHLDYFNTFSTTLPSHYLDASSLQSPITFDQSAQPIAPQTGTCEHCGKTFSLQRLEAHRRQRISGRQSLCTTRFPCALPNEPGCHKTFAHERGRLRHRDTVCMHARPRTGPIRVFQCQRGKTVKRWDQFKKHKCRKLDNVPTPSFTCKCGSTFDCMAALEAHHETEKKRPGRPRKDGGIGRELVAK
ncbi:hypothetical protein GGR51DRAFT_71494 [Nemania sp. FL0031]|nr:hypothetical protein GGR51DRAFT_71494 [Nemania sp. FL0031]